MHTFISLFCQKYTIEESALVLLLSKMTLVTFENRQLVLDQTYSKSNYYIITKGIWRAYKLIEGNEITLWFERYGDIMYSEITPNYSIESIGESEAYCIDKKELDELCLTSHEISNLIRLLIERFYFDITRISVDFSHQLAKERYLSMLEKDPELFQLVPQKHIASFLGLTPQSLSRLRRKISKK
ncbi:Crp/Fnr family transcriptional regulator [Myroides odoratus]|uniref:Crp/Fnr family transcriptional regulator n=1 Tax=Myroides odoratus TaxID=256 RepID=UPI0039B005BE